MEANPTDVLQVGFTNVFTRNQASKANVLVNVGGAGSSKSHSVAQLLVTKFTNEDDKQLIITRKTLPALKRSAYALIVDLFKAYHLYDQMEHNKTDHVIHYRSNAMWFFGIDEPTKAKSLAGGASYIWMEEADEFTYEDYLAFKLQLRRQTEGGVNQIFLTFNPIDGSGWIPTKLIGQPDVAVIHSTVDDNPYADPEYVKLLKNLATEDENYYRVYVLGEWGRLENLIFPNYTLVDALPEKFDAWCYGLDFGFVHPTALIKVVISDKKLYWHEYLCQSGMTNSDLIERLTHFDKGDIYADSAEPQRIREINNAGFTCLAANKDVRLGIDVCRRQQIHITKDSVNLIKQIRGYQRQVDKNGIVLEQPVKFRDDTVDAARYGTLGVTERHGFATARPHSIEPIKSLHFPGDETSLLDKLLRRNK